MKRLLQHPSSWVAAAVAAAAVLLTHGPEPVRSQGPAKYPTVDKAGHMPYVDKVHEIAFDMVPIPGGTFLMGSPDGEKGRGADEGPVHPVQIKPFWMSKHEVRWDEYDWYWTRRFPKGQPPPRPDITKKPDKPSDAVTSPTPPYTDPTFGHGKEGNPVLGITHHAAMEFCRWISEKTGKHYRLPTEAEWEWACRAGTTTAYSFGDDPAKLDEFAWYEKNSEEVAHKVATRTPNPWGLYDMHGNVSEWVIDSYAKDFYSTLPKDRLTLNPFRAPTEDRYPYVCRGGSWIDPPEKCRSAARRFSDKTWLRRDPQNPQSIWWMTDADFVGIRLVRAVDEDDRLKGIRSKVTWWSPD